MKRYLAIAAAAMLASSSLAMAQSASPSPGGGPSGATSQSAPNDPSPSGASGQPNPGGGPTGTESSGAAAPTAGATADPSKACQDQAAQPNAPGNASTAGAAKDC